MTGDMAMALSLLGLWGGESNTEVRVETVGVESSVLDPAIEEPLRNDIEEVPPRFILEGVALFRG